MKGFVFSFDALLALFILFMMITIAFDGLSHQGAEIAQRQRLRAFAHYASVALEESGELSKAVLSNNTSSIRTFLDSWPTGICGTVSVYPSPDTNNATFIVGKGNCTSSLGTQEVVRTGFIVPSPPDANVYVATIATWVNTA